MIIEIPRKVNTIISQLNASGFDAFIVGGCVRDSILGRVPGDWDVTTQAKPYDIKKIFRPTIDTGIEHGTVTVLIQGEPFEVTTYRLDGDYSDKRHPDKVEFTNDLREDLLRRDFTINAMAYSDKTGIIDEFEGMKDLDAKIIRCVGNPDERFDEDALRILRAIRFAAQLGFEIEQDTYDAIARHASDLQYVSKERILVELTKTLESAHPEKIRLLWDLGIVPYISENFGLIKKSDAPRSWAELMKDLNSDEVYLILKELKADNETVRCAQVIAEEYKNDIDPSEVGVRKLLMKIGPELYDLLIDIKKRSTKDPDGIIEKAQRTKEGIFARGDCYSLKQLAVSGADLIAAGYKQGPELGAKLAELLDAVIATPQLNTKEKLMKLI